MSDLLNELMINHMNIIHYLLNQLLIYNVYVHLLLLRMLKAIDMFVLYMFLNVHMKMMNRDEILMNRTRDGRVRVMTRTRVDSSHIFLKTRTRLGLEITIYKIKLSFS
jgi:hypothetical protein